MAEPARSVGRWNLPHTNHHSLDAFLSQKDIGTSVNTINNGDDFFDFLLDIRPNAESLIVMLNSALQKSAREENTFPIFSGTRALEGLNCHVLMISDPTLHCSPRITMGWYLGNSRFDVSAYCRDIITHISSILKPKKLILSGFSVGGFASLNISQMIPGSVAMPFNPQVNLLAYAEYYRNILATDVFGVGKFSEIPQDIVRSKRMNLNLIYGEEFQNKVLYIQNGSDYHLKQQARPFLKSVGIDQDPIALSSNHLFGDDRNFMLYVGRSGNWPKGHVGPRRGLVREVFRAVCEDARNPADIVSQGFTESLLASDQHHDWS